MKLQIENPLGIVTSAFFKEGNNSFSLYINTQNRALPGAYSSNCEAKGAFGVYYYTDDDTNTAEDKVVLIPETEQDKKWLDCFHFELQSKGQLWIIFLPPEVYEEKT